MKKLMVWTLIFVVLLISVTGCSSNDETSPPVSDDGEVATNGGSEYEKLNLKLNISGTEQGIDAIAANKFGELVKEASDGNITVDLYASSQLAGGDMSRSIELLMQGGSFELAILSGSVLSNLDEKFLTHMVPFNFENYEHVSSFLDGTGGEYYKTLMKEKGIIGMGVLHNGLKQFTNGEKEIKKPSDLENMKMRIPGGEVGIMTFKALGADPISMTWGEVYTALQQGTIDGHENSYQTIWSASIQEVQPYITEINWAYDGYWFMASENEWNKFSEATQELIMEKSIEAAEYARTYQEEQEIQIKKDFIDAGITITELTAEERKAFVDATSEVREYFINKYGDEASDAWGMLDN